ncbi:hypothetical protein CEXT_792901 [Caerostris extrusa]|uniref:Uncharacterized protein n=1 Tax=Caerostris extrusa TaxID=172846 RepID=A0AAV4T0Q5_CAEEX|nr:hypothetical protein CEXT_792901 [Caerostris extrusa]
MDSAFHKREMRVLVSSLTCLQFYSSLGLFSKPLFWAGGGHKVAISTTDFLNFDNAVILSKSTTRWRFPVVRTCTSVAERKIFPLTDAGFGSSPSTLNPLLPPRNTPLKVGHAPKRNAGTDGILRMLQEVGNVVSQTVLESKLHTQKFQPIKI